MKVGEALRAATTRLAVDWARDDAELLMAHALGVSRSAMLLNHLQASAPAAFEAMLERRLANEPVAYITGDTEFLGRRFTVSPDVLIPRGDSEAVVLAAIEAAPDARRVLDCGTGSGCLLLTLLAELPQATGIGIDRSPSALTVAKANAALIGVDGREQFRVRDWTRPGWTAGLGTFDLIIANPPYVEDEAELDASVRDHEPAMALFAGPDGLDAYRVLVPQLPALLAPEGAAVLEIGWRQAAAVAALADEAGLSSTLRQDLAGRDRALILRIKGLAKAE